MSIDTKFHYEDDKLIIQRVQDVEPIIEANKRAMDVDDKRFKSQSFNLVARVPTVLIEKYRNETGIDLLAPENVKLFRKWLDDPDHKFLKTKPVKLVR